MLVPMGGWILCVVTIRAPIHNVYLLPQLYVRLITRYSLPGPTYARTSGMGVQTLTAAAVSLRQYQAPRLIVSLILNGAQYISRIPVRRRTSRYACMRMIRTNALTSSSARFSRGAINCMFRVCRVQVTPLRRTSAVLARPQQARALISAE
jgi:hypothetical protein